MIRHAIILARLHIASALARLAAWVAGRLLDAVPDEPPARPETPQAPTTVPARCVRCGVQATAFAVRRGCRCGCCATRVATCRACVVGIVDGGVG